MKRFTFKIIILQAVSCTNLTNDDIASMRSMSIDETPGNIKLILLKSYE